MATIHNPSVVEWTVGITKAMLENNSNASADDTVEFIQKVYDKLAEISKSIP